ncbi:DUF2971 domain-containing protein [Puia sp. P3]|uniref:DUF2971 domain-containing protein n=1 Tax=Puia sp. P3 TaxID=3423952 RepID=UPI003D673248
MIKFLEDVPDVLYKYRDWHNEYHRKLLTHRELYFASVDQFNDPFDGTVPYRYDPAELTEENIFRKYREMTKKEHPDWDEQRVHEDSYEYQRRGYFKDGHYLEEFEKWVLETMSKQFGVVCLCRKPDNFLLWSHYANSHAGICVGFDKYKLFEDAKCQFAHMQYQEQLPLLSLFDDVFTHFKKLIGTKSLVWEYEEEYRLTRAEFSRVKAYLRPETVVEVTLGCKMPERERFEMVEFVAANLPHARVYEMVKSKTAFRIERMQIF